MKDSCAIVILSEILYIFLLVWLYYKGIDHGATERRREYEQKKKRRKKELWEQVEKWRQQEKLWKEEK